MPGPMRRASSLEATDVALVLDGVGRLQSQLLDPLFLLLGVGRGNGGLVALILHPFVLAQVRKVSGMLPMVRSVLLVERHGHRLQSDGTVAARDPMTKSTRSSGSCGFTG